MRRAVLSFLALLLPISAAAAEPSQQQTPQTLAATAPTAKPGPVRVRGWYEPPNPWALNAPLRFMQKVDENARVKLVLAVAADNERRQQQRANISSDVAGCVKGAESGTYTESTHPEDGSGAYQFIPNTWRHYYLLWRAALADTDPEKGQDYTLAYMAPPWVQDAVFAYTVANGGAHNWDPSYGNDTCTVGLP